MTNTEGSKSRRISRRDFIGIGGMSAAAVEEVVEFGNPVVLVHGDSHTFRIDKPTVSETRPLNFTRV